MVLAIGDGAVVLKPFMAGVSGRPGRRYRPDSDYGVSGRPGRRYRPDSDYVFSLPKYAATRPTVKVTINGVKVRMDVDSCSSANIMDIDQYIAIAKYLLEARSLERD